MKERIVVTGYGIISNLGYGAECTKNALLTGKKSIHSSSHLNTIHDKLPVGEISYTDEELKELLKLPSSETITRTPLLAMAALKEAIERSGITNQTRTAFINGTTVGGMDKREKYNQEMFNGEKKEYISLQDGGSGTEQVARLLFGEFDLITTISTACSSAANSIAVGCDMIKAGRVEAAIVGGAESLSKFHLNGFNSLMILETSPCKPFDKESHGLNLGEGAAFLVIEKESSALARGANIICEISGYANACDAFHQTATSAECFGAISAMENALKSSGLQPSDIDYINAHGTGTDDNDLHESIALKKVFGSVPPFSSTKSFTGHTTSAAGAVEAVISIIALTNGFIPANLSFSQPIEETGLTPVIQTVQKELTHVMSNSFGFGGNDTVCIFSKYNH